VLDVLDEPQAWADARLLDEWLAGVGDSPIGDVLRLGPGPLRDKARRNAAIEVLAELGRARVERCGRRETLTRNSALRHVANAKPAKVAKVQGPDGGSFAKVATFAFAEPQSEETEEGSV
jgi:hypothetical protein